MQILEPANREWDNYELPEKNSEHPMLYAEYDRKQNHCFYTPQLKDEFWAEYTGGDIIRFMEDRGIVAREDKERFQSKICKLLSGERRYVDILLRLRCRNGEYHLYRLMMQETYDKEENPACLLAAFIDVEQERLLIDRLRREAGTDKLTGIYNEPAFYEEAGRMLADGDNVKYVIARMDIERFRVINDILGMKRGDAILCTVADVLREMKCREAPRKICFGRILADVFALCFPDEEGLAERIVEFCAKRINQAYPDYEISLNFGLYVVEDREEPVEVMVNYANLAADEIQGDFLKKFAYYDKKMHDKAMNEQYIINGLEEALEQKQFRIAVQPKCRISDGAVVGAEALVRWMHPEHGVVPPVVFIPVLEKTRLIYKLDRYVWEEVCILLRKQLDEGKKPVPISVNVSQVDLLQPDLCSVLKGLRERYRIPDSLLELEITESGDIKTFQAYMKIIGSLKENGFRILLDDFGSAYSTLNVLCNTEFNVIKIDMKSIANQSSISGNEKVKALLASLAFMSKALLVPAVIEGVETREQVEFLKGIGMEYAQGYYFYKPMPQEEYERLF